MARVRLRYLEIFRAHGKRVAFYRRDGQRVRLRDEAGDAIDPVDAAGLAAAWHRAHTEHERLTAKAEAAELRDAVRPHSIKHLIQEYRASPEWEEKAASTQADYEKALAPLERDWGHLLAAGLQRHHIKGVRDRYARRVLRDGAGRPVLDDRDREQLVPNARQANRVITVLSILLSFAVELGWRSDNPALRPKRLRAKGAGYEAWRPEQFQQFWDRSSEAWRFAALLALTTAQRGQDQVAMRWQDFDGESLYVVQEKGRRLVKLWVKAHEELLPLLLRRQARNKRAKVQSLTILTRPDGQPWPVNAFQKAAGQAIRAAGLEGIVWHGLRSTAMGWAAEGGATTRMLQSLAGHRTSRMAEHYSRGADQKRMAAAAVDALVVPLKGRRKNAGKGVTANASANGSAKQGRKSG